MGVYFCRACSSRVVTRSEFEAYYCPECGGEDTLEAADAYDDEPPELVCKTCRYRVQGGGRGGADDADYDRRLSVDDPCPRCGHETLVPASSFSRGKGSTRAAPQEQPEYGLARRVAEQLLEKHWTGETPVDVEKVAKGLGLEVKYGPFGHEGLLVDGRIIEVPEHEARVAQRFAIAHEIGHHQLRHKVNEDKIEPEANALASELLMPRKRLRRGVELGYTMAQLCELFEVSREALVYALEGARLLNKVKG